MLLLIRDIEEVNRVNTLFYVPNALSIVMKDKSEYFLGSFIDREQCYANLISLSDVGKHMASLPGYDEASILRNLEFGYQTRNNFFGGPDDPDSPPPAPGQEGPAMLGTAAPSADASDPSHAEPEPAASPTRKGGPFPVTPAKSAEGPMTPPRGSPVPVAAPSPEQPRTPTRSSPTPAATTPAPTPAHSANALSPAAITPVPPNTPAPTAVKTPAATPAAPSAPQAQPVTPPPPAAAARSRAESRVVEAEAVDVEDGINLSTLFERSNISMMQEKVLTVSTTKLWSTCWLHGKGYG